MVIAGRVLQARHSLIQGRHRHALIWMPLIQLVFRLSEKDECLPRVITIKKCPCSQDCCKFQAMAT